MTSPTIDELETRLEELWQSCRTLQRDERGTIPAIRYLQDRFLAVIDGMAAEELRAVEALKVSDPDQYQRRVEQAKAASEAEPEQDLFEKWATMGEITIKETE